jgi:hypothetical protein
VLSFTDRVGRILVRPLPPVKRRAPNETELPGTFYAAKGVAYGAFWSRVAPCAMCDAVLVLDESRGRDPGPIQEPIGADGGGPQRF